MYRLLRSHLLLAAALLIWVSYAVVGALAAPDITPWPDPSVAGEEVDETPEATETEEAETPDPLETPEADDVDEQGDTVEVEVEDAGVLPDSPACAGTPADPNPHDTDGDGDGCREVDVDGELKNLPDPAADAHEGNPGKIGNHGEGNNGNGGPDGDNNGRHVGPPEGRPFGPPDGDPPHGPPAGRPVGPPAP